MPNLTVIAIITAKDDCKEEVLEGLTGLIAPTLREKGCINYDLHIDNENPRVFAFHETWESEGDLNNHLESGHIKSFQKSSEGKIEAVQMHRMTKC